MNRGNLRPLCLPPLDKVMCIYRYVIFGDQIPEDGMEINETLIPILFSMPDC